MVQALAQDRLPRAKRMELRDIYFIFKDKVYEFAYEQGDERFDLIAMTLKNWAQLCHFKFIAGMNVDSAVRSVWVL